MSPETIFATIYFLLIETQSKVPKEIKCREYNTIGHVPELFDVLLMKLKMWQASFIIDFSQLHTSLRF